MTKTISELVDELKKCVGDANDREKETGEFHRVDILWVLSAAEELTSALDEKAVPWDVVEAWVHDGSTAELKLERKMGEESADSIRDMCGTKLVVVTRTGQKS